jgi:hypothetical protein
MTLDHTYPMHHAASPTACPYLSPSIPRRSKKSIRPSLPPPAILFSDNYAMTLTSMWHVSTVIDPSQPVISSLPITFQVWAPAGTTVDADSTVPTISYSTPNDSHVTTKYLHRPAGNSYLIPAWIQLTKWHNTSLYTRHISNIDNHTGHTISHLKPNRTNFDNR